MSVLRNIRFKSTDLHRAFVNELRNANVSYQLDDNGAVVFGGASAEDIIDAAHRVHDALFPWYFLKWKTEERSAHFSKILTQAGLPFFVESHEDEIWYVVRRADRERIDRLWPMTLSENDIE